jgi:hypothetical protein
MMKTKNPGSRWHTNRARQKNGGFMSLVHIITYCRESKAYFRRLVIRAIEDFIILTILGLGVAAVCVILGAILRWMGVG